MASLPTLLQTPEPGINHPSTALHLLPVHIAYSGPARIASYFPVISTGNDLYKSYFRGRLLVGVEVPLPAGYCGQVWKSNAPSVSNSRASTSTSKSISKSNEVSTGYSSTDYSASSPRRSPRKRASTSTIDASSSSTVASKAGNSKNTQAKGKKKPPPKRQRFAMSPDVSPVKEAAPSHDATMAFEEALDKAAETLDNTTADQADEGEDCESSQEVIVTSPSKKRAKLEAEAEINPKPEAEEMKMEEDGNVTLTMTAESTTTTIQAGGETITSTTVKLERAVTPPPPSSAPTVPSTPMSASSNTLPINVISPQTPRTPRSTAFSSHQASEYDGPSADDATDNERVHQRLIQQVGSFNKITIWNPDIELDKGDDCYVRSLTEWTSLSDLVSRFLSPCRYRLLRVWRKTSRVLTSALSPLLQIHS